MTSTETPQLLSPERLARYLDVSVTLISLWGYRKLLWPDFDVERGEFGYDLGAVKRVLKARARQDLANELDELTAELIRVARRVVRQKHLDKSW